MIQSALKHLTLLCIYLGFSAAYAQSPAIEADIPIGPVLGVYNTGNSTVGPSPEVNQFSVSCWDGATPSFHFDAEIATGIQPIIGVAGAYINDPDVVVFPNTPRFCIVYLLGGHVYAEGWVFDPDLGICIPLYTPVMISNGTPTCKTPNIDQLADGAAIVWEQEGNIKGRYWDATGIPIAPALGPEVNFTACVMPGMSNMPDVSIYRDGPDDVANVVFVHHAGGADRVMVQRHDLDNFHIGLPVSCGELSIVSTPADPDQHYNDPRIASPAAGAPHFTDCQIVVTKNDFPDGTSEIIGINRFSGGAYMESSLNSAFAGFAELRNCTNKYPVVAYTGCGGVLMAEWEYSNTGGCLAPFGGSQVLATRLDPATGWRVDANYARLNLSAGSARRPSVAGRYRFVSGLNVMSSWHDAASVQMNYKFSPCFTDQMKQEATAMQRATADAVRIFPNPFSTSVQILLPENVETNSVSIVNMHGQTVHKWTKVASGTRALQWDSSELPAGVYIVRVVGSSGIDTHTLQKFE